jgi:hypothetical protein
MYPAKMAQADHDITRDQSRPGCGGQSAAVPSAAGGSAAAVFCMNEDSQGKRAESECLDSRRNS